MFQIDTKKEKLTLVEVFGRPALFTTERVNRGTVPEGLHAYDMQTSEDDWILPIGVLYIKTLRQVTETCRRDSKDNNNSY